MTKYAFNLGALLGVILIIVDYISHLLDMHESSVFQVLTIAILIGGLVYCVKNYRDTYQNGYISYGEGVKIGALVSIAAAILLAVYSYVFFKFIDSEMLAELQEEAINGMYADDSLTDEQIEQAIPITRMFMSPASMAFFAFLSQAIIGTIVSLIISAFLKKEEPFMSEEV